MRRRHRPPRQRPDILPATTLLPRALPRGFFIMSSVRAVPVCLSLFPLLVSPARAGEDPPSAVTLPVVRVNAQLLEAPVLALPAADDTVAGEDLRRNRPQVNVSEGLGFVPGLQLRERQNYAQDLQISVRGFGARASFGIRGIRLVVDGIPATLPDGQGQLSQVELGTVERIEVLRGPFSALDGNAAGGVLRVFTEDGSDRPEIRVDAGAGSHQATREGVQAGGRVGEWRYRVGASHFQTDGFRDHSAAERNLGNAKFSWQPDDDRRLSLVLNHVDLPEAQDPLGLTRAQMQADPSGVDPVAETFNTRKRMGQTQGGLTYLQRLGPQDTLRAQAYLGHRSTTQYQSIPVATQANPLHPGGVIDLDRDYQGLELRWVRQTTLLDQPLAWTVGLAWDVLMEQRRGEQNFTGSGDTLVTGVKGALRRDEDNRVANLDPYLQLNWRWAPQWLLQAGLRHSNVRFTSSDHYTVGSNPDDSGQVRDEAWLPMLGLSYQMAPGWRAYASIGRGEETPTLNELAYRAGGQTGMNFALRPASSTSAELGLQWATPDWGQGELALFETRTAHEIVTQTNAGGRATYQNAGGTLRRGLELGWSVPWASAGLVRLNSTFLDAHYRDSFLTCTGTPCTRPSTVIEAGNRLPGLARSTVALGLDWQPSSGWHAGAEWRYVGRLFVNDANSDAAAAATTVALSSGYQWRGTDWSLDAFARVDNLLDRRYVGSVIVNDGNGRYFEPAPGRSWWAGIRSRWQF